MDGRRRPAWSTTSRRASGRQIGPYRVSRRSAAAAWASSMPPATNGSAAWSRSRRCRRSTRAIAGTATGSRREARAAASFTHESIATVYRARRDRRRALHRRPSWCLERRCARSSRAARSRRIVSCRRSSTSLPASSAAHARSIIHRDLKPENVIRRTDGRIKILDFGLARITDPRQCATVTRLTEPGTAPGTPGYMAPEQVTGGAVDGRTDLFAFGVVAWELATGEHPFGSNPALMLARMMEGRPPSLSRQLSQPAARPDHPPLPARLARRALSPRPTSSSPTCARCRRPNCRLCRANPRATVCGGGSSIRRS